MYRKFGTGSLQTLWHQPRERGIDVRAALQAFHNRWYSADMMKLCVVGPQPIETLQDWVVTMFSSVKSGSLGPPAFDPVRFGPEQLGQILYMRTVKQVRRVELKWSLPCAGAPAFGVADQPERLIGHILGYEGVHMLCYWCGVTDTASCVACAQRTHAAARESVTPGMIGHSSLAVRLTLTAFLSKLAAAPAFSYGARNRH